MADESEAREKLALLARIFAMQGMLGLFGHISVYDPERKKVLLTPGMGSDKANLSAADMVLADLDGRPERNGRPPVEWPIHTALHAARSDALAVAHLHSPHATLFTIAQREFQPVTLQGAIFSGGVPLYDQAHLITTPERGRQLVQAIGSKRAVLLRAHGNVVVGKNLEEVLYGALVLEDDAKKSAQAAALGPLSYVSPEECRAFGAELALDRRAQRAWDYFSHLEKRWDRQPGTGRIELFP
jgi:ribulose-5-phosphate 4-epimerase/fuculose-1-phosphate aldolase